ncbi:MULTISPECIES: GspH/FimT family pseudopilin [unclassified Simplicispira]|jgi:type IV fimbrial biogenesis protein FimT|uniref:GspH/FimT family pseudopilin n=1 Tax=unclassified Simplicispira TaxID=2630407 RepID=UPI000D5E80F1|nr:MULTISPECIES: GspH/FimT family pseudopilin [unclassified Simplicispira]PVY56199.1 type IV fimbrial biogenesis protein FimT [Simplicispira sp. 125]REG17144.1 type IV fimbrial biogenesis protein FimT [Simplicispira sp. 110]
MPSLKPLYFPRQTGFTAIELMVVVSIIAILAALAAPSFTPLIERWRVRQAAENLTSTIYYARSEAIKRGGGVAIDASGGWSTGWKVTHTQNSTTTDLQVNSAPTKTTLTQVNGKTVLYIDRWGMLSETSGGAPMGMSFPIYPAGKTDTDASAIRLCLTSSGRVLQKQQGAACPT